VAALGGQEKALDLARLPAPYPGTEGLQEVVRTVLNASGVGIRGGVVSGPLRQLRRVVWKQGHFVSRLWQEFPVSFVLSEQGELWIHHLPLVKEDGGGWQRGTVGSYRSERISPKNPSPASYLEP
jgi:hypothetical protein